MNDSFNEVNISDNEVENENNKESQCTAKYGIINLDDNHFMDKDSLGENFIHYKPEKIVIWTGDNKGTEMITGIETSYRNIINNTIINVYGQF